MSGKPLTIQQKVKGVTPAPLWDLLRRFKRARSKSVRRLAELAGYKIDRKRDYYSVLPTESVIERNAARWNRPSALRGINFNVDVFRSSLERLLNLYWNEFASLSSYQNNRTLGFGPGYTEVDALTSYMMIRDLKPRRYLEVGSGLSTYYCSLAAARNATEGKSCDITCVEPYPFDKLFTIPDIKIIRDEVQNVPVEEFQKLEAGDVLFIDSSHVAGIDSDVVYLFLEILPAVSPGVFIHVHDIPFPYNTPYPAEYWVLGTAPGARYWPTYWNEAMLLQAFLAFNDSFQVIQSLPLLRSVDEQYLRQRIPTYRSVAEEPNTFSSIWLQRVK
jgi:hypothetical protein